MVVAEGMTDGVVLGGWVGGRVVIPPTAHPAGTPPLTPLTVSHATGSA